MRNKVEGYSGEFMVTGMLCFLFWEEVREI
jgi:hypothetical protein